MTPETPRLPYRVELDTKGCAHCGAGDSYTVVGPDDVGWGISWDKREDADDFADAMNAAYEQGQKVPAPPEVSHE
jgi:hypothetical protein